MSNKVSFQWLKASYSDLVLIEEIIGNEYLTHMVAFHAQQSIEKAFKAVIESLDKKVPRKHDLLLLKDNLEDIIPINNEDILEDLNELYIDSRYPGDMGLLPNGKPTIEDAKEFFTFAKDVFNKVCKTLDIDKEKLI